MKKKVCAAMVFVFTAVMASGCVKKEEIQKYSHVDYAMGTVTNTTLYGLSLIHIYAGTQSGLYIHHD